MRMLTGRIAVAAKLLLAASQRVAEWQVHEVEFVCESEREARNLRTACYNYQKRWMKDLAAEAIQEGRDPILTVNKAVLDAAWPSASIHYIQRDNEHLLRFSFMRLMTDPNWDDLIISKLKRVEPELSAEEVFNLTQEKGNGKGTKD